MIQFTYDNGEGRQNLGLGISRENVNRLIEGKPIRLNLAALAKGLTISGEITIYFAETERELTQAVAEFIGPDTKVHIDPRLKGKMT